MPATPAGNDFACLDDVQFTPGTTLTVNGHVGQRRVQLRCQRRNDRRGPQRRDPHLRRRRVQQLCVPGQRQRHRHPDRQRPAATALSLYANGSGQLSNSTAGYTVNVDGMASIIATGHAGDTAQFFDSPGNDMFYAYADYNDSGQQLAGMYGSGYSNSASGFGTNIGNSTNGGNDMAGFFDSPGNDTFYSYTDYNNSGQQLAGMYGSYGGGYSNSAKGFGTNVGFSSNGGSDTAVFYDSLGNDHLLCLRRLPEQRPAVGGHAAEPAVRIPTRPGASPRIVAYSTAGGSDTAEFFDSPGNDTFSAYANYNGSGQTLASMYGSYALPAAIPTRPAVSARWSAISINGGNDTANLYGSPGNDTLYTDAAIASLYGDNGSYTDRRWGSRSSTPWRPGREQQGPNSRGLPVELFRHLGLRQPPLAICRVGRVKRVHHPHRRVHIGGTRFTRPTLQISPAKPLVPVSGAPKTGSGTTATGPA